MLNLTLLTVISKAKIIFPPEEHQKNICLDFENHPNSDKTVAASINLSNNNYFLLQQRGQHVCVCACVACSSMLS